MVKPLDSTVEAVDIPLVGRRDVQTYFHRRYGEMSEIGLNGGERKPKIRGGPSSTKFKDEHTSPYESF